MSTSTTTLEDPVVRPSQDDPVAGVVNALGGPPGRHTSSAPRSFWRPVRVIVALTLLACALGFWQKSPCRDHAWAENYQYTRACYNDPFPLYGARGFAGEGLPYVDNTLEYPVLIGGMMHVAAEAVEGFDPAQRGKRFFDVTALMMTAFAVVVAITTTRLAGRRRPWDAVLFAAAPGLVLTVFNNWDMAAAAFVGLGMLAWARKHPAWAGIAFGLGAATKLYPALLLGPLILLCIRAGKVKEVAGAVGTAALAWAVVNVPVAVAAPEGWREFYSFSSERGADWGSLWYFHQYLRGPLDVGLAEGEAPHTLNTLASGLFLLACIGIAVLVLRAPQRPRVAQVLFLTLLAFMLTNKVFSPQFVIWLLPLAVLARPRWRTFLLWQATEAIAFFAIWYYLIHIGDQNQGISDGWYFAALLLRDAALLLFAARVVHEVMRPDKDVVRRDGVDDPAGGVLDGAPDWAPLKPLLGKPRSAAQQVPAPVS